MNEINDMILLEYTGTVVDSIVHYHEEMTTRVQYIPTESRVQLCLDKPL